MICQKTNLTQSGQPDGLLLLETHAPLLSRAVFNVGGGGMDSTPSEIMTKQCLMCPSVSIFHISVQRSFNVDQFMQTFDS